MNNLKFLGCIAKSFKVFLETSSRSNQKLKILHGAIAKDLLTRLGNDYKIKSLGLQDGKEGKIQGRYIDKNIDITIFKGEKVIAGIGVKFVMQNYSQNSNNYFENMLGETANIRSEKIPYFQIFIIPDTIPYYDNNGTIKKWETFSEHNSHKYKVMSKDNVEVFVHTPTKTLLYVVKLPQAPNGLKNKSEYIEHYNSLRAISIRNTDNQYGDFDSSVIFNNYDEFMEKVVHRIKSE